MQNKNILYKEKYIISQELQTALTNETMYDNKQKVAKNVGIYLVAVRLLNKEDNTLVYNYIYYPKIFIETLIVYLINRNFNSTRYSEWGDVFIVINKDVFSHLSDFNFDVSNVEDSRFMFADTERFDNYFDSLGTYYSSSPTVNLIDLINTLMLATLNMNELTIILGYALKKNYREYIHYILKPFILKRKFDTKEISNEEDINLINSCLFIVNDINVFKENVTKKGYIINEGPQKWRGQVNSMSGLLSNLDLDYRNSLFYHNNYHVRFGQVSSELALPKSKFSFRNIHMNLGNVRWYSTKINRSSVKQKLIDRLNSQSFKSDSMIYLHLNRFLKNSPLNEETERKIEEFLLQCSYSKLANKDTNRYEFLSDVNIKKLLVDSIDVLNDYISNFMKKTYNINTKRPSQNTISRHHLQLILKQVGDSFIIEISLGMIARILSNYNKLEDDSLAVNIFNDIGKTIISKYFYTLYRNYILKNTESFIEECSLYLKSNNLEEVDKNKALEILESLNKSKHKYEVYEIFSEINKILLIDNINNINLNDTNLISQYTLSDWKLDNKDIVQTFDDTTLINNIGAIIVEWLNEAELIQQNTVTVAKNDRRNYIFPSENITKILNTNKDYSIKHLPLRIPMIVKPKLFSRESTDGKIKERLGGYLLNDEKVTDSMIIPNWELKKSSIIQKPSVIYNLVNNINSVAFKINVDMLNFIYDYGDEFNLLLETLELSTVKSRITKSEYTQLESYIGKLDLQENILGLAKVYTDIPEFYLPVRIDYRGRVNCISQYLNYQSTELAKSLLLFSKGEKLYKNDDIAVRYFKAYGANCYGNKLDKKSWLDRSKWIDDNEQDILNYTNGKLIKQAENKLLFVSFCIEYNKWKECYDNIETSYFITHLPIQLDASCNGYQHLSLLVSDYDMARELNLTKSTWKDIPKDYYGFLAIKLQELFKNKLRSEEILSQKDIECYERLNSILIKRSTIKKAIMTIPYNVSTHQMIAYIKENFIRINQDENSKKDWSPYTLEYQYKEDSDILLSSKDITFIASGLREVLELNFPKLKLLVLYLKNIATICNKLNLTIPWGTSSGLLVNQSYMASKEVKLRPFSFSKSSFMLKVPTGRLNTNKQVRAFMPNLVHSLDAASLALLADHYFNGENSKSFYAIHDCFAVTANNVDILIKYLKLVYIKIYSQDDYLRNMDKEIIQHIKYHYSSDCFNEETLEIKVDDITLKYPDINYVIGNKLPSPDLIVNSSYLIT